MVQLLHHKIRNIYCGLRVFWTNRRFCKRTHDTVNPLLPETFQHASVFNNNFDVLNNEDMTTHQERTLQI